MATIANILECPSCVGSVVTLPPQTTDPDCGCALWNDGIADIYFIDCSEINAATIEADLLDPVWWTGLKTDGKIHRFGIGTGAISTKNAITRDVPDGCGATKQIRINTEWQLTYEKVCFDESVNQNTHEEMNAMINGALKNRNVVVRYCKGEFIGWIGGVSLSNYDAPHNGTDGLKLTYEFSWKNKNVIVPINVAGLNAILPKPVATY
ncbi:MAG: hypothetical protein ACEQSR_08615 [Candidatus Methylacidiphilales bacterium]